MTARGGSETIYNYLIMDMLALEVEEKLRAQRKTTDLQKVTGNFSTQCKF